MGRIPAIHPKNKWLTAFGVLVSATLCANLSAQQLYSDSARRANELQVLCMILPDTSSVVINTNSIPANFQIPEVTGVMIATYVTDWCCATNQYINFSSFLISPVWSCTTVSVQPLIVTVPPPHRIPECTVGIAAAAPAPPVKLPPTPYSAKAAQHFSGLVPEE